MTKPDKREVISAFRAKSSTRIYNRQTDSISRLIDQCRGDTNFIYRTLLRLTKGQKLKHYETIVWQRWNEEQKKPFKIIVAPVNKMVQEIANRKSII